MITRLSIFCDGGARGNPGPAAGAFVVKDDKGKVLHQQAGYFGRATNNQAEYQAVILALEWLVKQPTRFNTINFYLDSKLVVNQLNGLFKIKNLKLQQLIIQIRILERKLGGEIFYHFVKREKNKAADKLLNQVLAQHS